MYSFKNLNVSSTMIYVLKVVLQNSSKVLNFTFEEYTEMVNASVNSI